MWSKTKVISEHCAKLCILPQRMAVPIVIENYICGIFGTHWGRIAAIY